MVHEDDDACNGGHPSAADNLGQVMVEGEEPPVKRHKGKLRGFDFYKSIGSPRFICAPMVDQSELAFRLLSRRYGVELAYTPMFHARLFGENAKYRKQQFSTCPEDKPVFAQFCGDDPDTLVRAAKFVESQVDAVDINCGCPQGIARKGHYGAFLLSEGDLLERIVSKMDKELMCPVTLKMRLLSVDDRDQRLQETLNLASRLEAAGVSILTVHGRTKEMKGQFVTDCDWQAIRAIKQRCQIPIFANGGIETYSDVTRCLEATGCDGVMSSEALLERPCLFSGREVRQDVLTEEYLELAKLHNAEKKCVKSHLFRFLYAGLQHHQDIRAQLGQAKDLNQICAAARALKERRDEEHKVGDVSWPDHGWYRRYRNPLGGKERGDKVEEDAGDNAKETPKHAVSNEAKDEAAE
jgi:tRNA-dihydrouridine synthase 1